MSIGFEYAQSMNSDVTFAEWLDARLRERDMTRRELALAMEMSEASIYSWLAVDAEHHRRISPRSADRLAAVLGVHPNEVREVAGLPKRRSASAFVPVTRMEGLTAARVLFVPVIGIAPANSLRHAAAIGELFPVPSNVVQHLSKPRAVIVSGDSLLSRGITDGDYLILETDIDAAKPVDGDIVVVRVGDDLAVKEYLKVGDRVLLRPTEPGYETIELDGSEDVQLIGVASSVWSGKRLR